LGKECYESLKENHQAAIEACFQSLELAEKYRAVELVPEILNSLGANFLLIEELESAQQYFTLALRKGDLVSDQIKISIFNNLGIIYKKREIIDSALYYYNEAYDLIQIEGNPILLAQNLNNRGNLLKNTGRFKEALFLYQECERVSKRNDLDFGVFVSLINTSNIYLKLGDPDLAITNIESAEEMAESIDISGYKKEIAINKYEAYQQKKDFKKALEYYVEFKDIEDSLKSNQLVLDLERLKTEYAE
jgi:tetratricopeptide (TPR) repeat protein